MDQQQNVLTMSRCLADGVISAEQAIDYGLSLAKELKRRHQSGVVASSLHPDRIGLNGTNALLLDRPDPVISRYSAPEVLDGHTPDTRSDIYSFGAVLAELATGRAAIEGNSPDEWKSSLARRESASSEGTQPGIARLLDRCLKRRPEERWQNISAVVVELKLLAAAQRHAKAASEWKHWLVSVQSGVDAVGQRLAAHQSANEAAIGEVHRAIGQVASKTEEHDQSFAAANQTLGSLGDAAAATTQKLGTLHETLHTAHAQLGSLGESVDAAAKRLGSLDESVHTARQDLGSLRESVRDLTTKTDIQARTIESIQSAVTQTDEVIDHVVDAFDSMHRLVIERAENGIAVAAQRPS